VTAIYNEIEPYAAEWLRNLVDVGHVAGGRVDERDVREVRAEDVRNATQFHAFAGIGVWSHALRLADWPDDRPVWTGSCPCQPFSVAGRKKGTADERHLWPEWFRLIRECRPPTVFGEQVASPAGRAWLDAVSADLEALGYAVGSADLCAAGVGAPQIRQRLFFVAHARSEGRCEERTDGGGGETRGGSERVEQRSVYGSSSYRVAYTAGAGRGRQGSTSESKLSFAITCEPGRPSTISGVADAGNQRREGIGVQLRTRGSFETVSEASRSGATRGFWFPADWLPCRDNKFRPVEPGSFPLAYGITNRVGRLRAYGNAIVPQVAAEFVKAFMDVVREPNGKTLTRKPRTKVLAPTKRVRRVIEDGFVWEDPLVGHVLACGDATDAGFIHHVTTEMADEPVRLALVDPPYNLSKNERITFPDRKDMFLNEDWDKHDEPEFAWFLAAIVERAAEAAPEGNVWIWTSDWWLSHVKTWLRELRLRVWPTYHWCKPNPAPSVRKANTQSAVEYLAMSGPTDPQYTHFDLDALPKQRNYFVAFPDGEFAPAVTPWWVERSVVTQKERLKRAGTTRDLNSTQKPLDLTEALVRAGCPEGGLILDTCGGTGTTLIAADRAGRRCVYLDNDPEQVRAAAKRLIRDRRER
jgi:DNA (cytosine-5)-methyltransferase 1